MLAAAIPYDVAGASVVVALARRRIGDVDAGGAGGGDAPNGRRDCVADAASSPSSPRNVGRANGGVRANGDVACGEVGGGGPVVVVVVVGMWIAVLRRAAGRAAAIDDDDDASLGEAAALVAGIAANILRRGCLRAADDIAGDRGRALLLSKS